MICNVMEHVRVDLAFADKLRLFLVSEKTGEREARVHLWKIDWVNGMKLNC